MATAEELLGALVVVGITYIAPSGAERQHQVAGVVERIDEDVILLRQANGTEFTLPPAPEWFEPTAPGSVFTLRATREQVVGPTFSATIAVNEPAGDEEAE